MEDPRNPAHITYTQADLVSMGMMKNVCSLKSMRPMEENLNEEVCIQILKILMPFMRQDLSWDRARDISGGISSH